MIIKQKEVHDKITPRESSVFSFSQGSFEKSIAMYGSEEGRKGKDNIINYGDIFNSATVNANIERMINSH